MRVGVISAGTVDLANVSETAGVSDWSAHVSDWSAHVSETAGVSDWSAGVPPAFNAHPVRTACGSGWAIEAS
jgi:hypothetical protein